MKQLKLALFQLQMQLDRVQPVLNLMLWHTDNPSTMSDQQLQVLSQRLVAEVHSLLSQTVGKVFRVWMPNADEQKQVTKDLLELINSDIEEVIGG